VRKRNELKERDGEGREWGMISRKNVKEGIERGLVWKRGRRKGTVDFERRERKRND
jgi:hypothetical protein